MKVRFEYADGMVWEGSPEDAQTSPDLRPLEAGWVFEPNDEGAGGLVRMVAICDFGTELVFAYQDFYWLRPTGGGAWEFGSGAQGSKFVLSPGERGSSATPVPLELPADAVIRVGVTVSQEDAVKFGLIGTIDEKDLHPKATVIITQGG